MSVRQVEAFQWTCEECGESGLEDTSLRANDMLGKHEDEAHAAYLFAPEPDVSEEEQ
jgi:hypothetical protein